MVRRSILLLCLPVTLSCTDEVVAPDSSQDSTTSAICTVEQKQCVSSTADSCCTLNGHRVQVDEDRGCKVALDEEWSYVVCVAPECTSGPTLTCYELANDGGSVYYLANNEIFVPGSSPLTPCQGLTGSELLAMPDCKN